VTLPSVIKRIPANDCSKGCADCRCLALEVQLGEIRRSPKPRIKNVSADLEIVGQGGEPVGFCDIQGVLKYFAAALVCAGVANGHRVAVVGDYYEQVGAGFGAPAVPQRFEQTRSDDQYSQQLETKCDPVSRAGPRCAAVRPD